ncbi:hypothetical protein [Rhodopirellula sallentina]|uniref:Uncharacterized protein n=1 Tax=Rhodopirellula sallentina SM41 TaxID=1263870 RepID=M5U6D9_9BACT|nr:hypothetical protein [Rhodopirellula sallentina]EMI56824.1 hypothetical protein RSSM_01767 [Rhodopirellula sallentina SM41]
MVPALVSHQPRVPRPPKTTWSDQTNNVGLRSARYQVKKDPANLCDEDRYFMRLVVMMLAFTVLPALLVIAYIIFYPESFQYDLVR